jgi:lysophospholipase L1-like esterase
MSLWRTSFCALLCCAWSAVGQQPRQVLLLGDSILDIHRGDRRIEAVLGRLLAAQAPQYRWTVANEAHGGEYIGPLEGSPKGVSDPLFTSPKTGRYFEIVKRHPRADAVVVNYAANDSKVYPPSAFRRKLEMLAALLEEQYPGAVLVFSTSVYLDPAHSAGYRIDASQVAGFVNGNSRDAYLEPYNKEIREFAAAHGYWLADTYRRFALETAKGNWDLRVRREGADPSGDGAHENDMAWFDNIHPNDRGTEAIAEGVAEALTRSR